MAMITVRALIVFERPLEVVHVMKDNDHCSCFNCVWKAIGSCARNER